MWWLSGNLSVVTGCFELEIVEQVIGLFSRLLRGGLYGESGEIASTLAAGKIEGQEGFGVATIGFYGKTGFEFCSGGHDLLRSYIGFIGWETAARLSDSAGKLTAGLLKNKTYFHARPRSWFWGICGLDHLDYGAADVDSGMVGDF
jgi:hypothetical protein